MPDLRISLDAEDFKKLVSGQIVEVDGSGPPPFRKVKVALEDIGYREMLYILIGVIDGIDSPEPSDTDTKTAWKDLRELSKRVKPRHSLP